MTALLILKKTILKIRIINYFMFETMRNYRLRLINPKSACNFKLRPSEIQIYIFRNQDGTLDRTISRKLYIEHCHSNGFHI